MKPPGVVPLVIPARRARSGDLAFPRWTCSGRNPWSTSAPTPTGSDSDGGAGHLRQAPERPPPDRLRDRRRHRHRHLHAHRRPGEEHRRPGRRDLLRHRRRRRPAGRALLRRARLRVPTAGSAYSYAYATTGEMFAWIIGWDLFLEFALGAAVVARGWSGYLGNLLNLPTSMFGEALHGQRRGGVHRGRADARRRPRHPRVRPRDRRPGDRQGGDLRLRIVAGALFVRGANLTPFIPPSQGSAGAAGLKQPLIQAVAGLDPAAFGIGGMLTAAAVVFFAYTGFEAVANLSRGDPQALPRPAAGPARHARAGDRALHRRLARGRRDGATTTRSTRARRSPTRSTRSGSAGPRPWSPSPPWPG